MIIGFGSTEQDFESAEKDAFENELMRLMEEDGAGYFSHNLVDSFEKWLKARADKYHADANRYKSAADYPDRYSHYWPTVLSDASHIAVILSVHHINRRHAFSPDGWALLRTEPVFVFKTYDLEQRFAA